MTLPLSIWAPLGKEAWRTGQQTIKTGAFVFVHTHEDRAFSDLRLYGAHHARQALLRLQQTYFLTPVHQARLIQMYVHAFVNGALDQLLPADS